METDVSLDNVTYVGEWDDWGWVCEVLGASCADGDAGGVRALPARGGLSSTMRHTQSWLVDGAHLSNVVELSTLGHSWVAADLGGRPRGRVELNPNKVTGRVLSLITGLRADHVTRADVAVDYVGVPVGAYSFSRPRVKGQYFTGSGGVESLYLGSRASERFVRVYDKALEQGRGDLVLTRVEGVGRARHVMEEGLFDGVDARSRELQPGMDPRVAGAIACALHYPEVVKSWDKRTRRRVSDLVEASQRPLSPSPHEVYREHRGRLLECIERVAAGEAVPVARVYC